MNSLKVLFLEIDQRLQTIDPRTKAKVLIKIEDELKSLSESNAQLSEEQLIKQWLEGQNLNHKLLIILKSYDILHIPQPEKPILKTFIISMSVVVVSFFLLIGLIFTFMSPVFEFNEKGMAFFGGRFQINNGLNMDIITGQNSISIRKNKTQNEQGRINTQDINKLLVTVNNGHLILNNSPSPDLIWECLEPVQHTYQDQNLILNLNKNNQCHIHLPSKLGYKFEVQNGLIQIHDPKYNLELELDKGQVQLKPDELISYKIDVDVAHGVAEVFESETQNFEYLIKIRVNQGMISHSY